MAVSLGEESGGNSLHLNGGGRATSLPRVHSGPSALNKASSTNPTSKESELVNDVNTVQPGKGLAMASLVHTEPLSLIDLQTSAAEVAETLLYPSGLVTKP